ncbi:peptidase C19, partial [Tyrophagus putrescentiae]
MGPTSLQQNITFKVANGDKGGESKENGKRHCCSPVPLTLTRSPLADESRSEVTFRCTIGKISQMKKMVHSQPFYFRNLPWNILVQPKMLSSPSNKKLKSLAYFLQCNRESESTNWSCYASAELRILAQKKSCEDLLKHISHVFTSKENVKGFRYYTEWAVITNPANGYLKNNTLIFEAKIKTDPPCDVYT